MWIRTIAKVGMNLEFIGGVFERGTTIKFITAYITNPNKHPYEIKFFLTNEMGNIKFRKNNDHKIAIVKWNNIPQNTIAYPKLKASAPNIPEAT